MSSEHLKALERLTPKLSAIAKRNPPPHNIVEFRLDGGEGMGINLYSTEVVAVMRVTLPKGAVFPAHGHEEQEYLILFSGHMIVNVGGEEIELWPGGCVSIPPGTPHYSTILEDSWLIAISIPRAEGYYTDD